MRKRQFGDIIKNRYQEDTESHLHYLIPTTFDHVMWATEFPWIMYFQYSEEMHNCHPCIPNTFPKNTLALNKALLQKMETLL